MSLGDTQVLHEQRAGLGGGGWVPPNGANSMAMSGLGLKSIWLEPG